MSKAYAVGFSNSGRTDSMVVRARDVRHAAKVAEKEGAELVLWVEGPFSSWAEADQYCFDGN